MENLHIVIGNLGADPNHGALPDGTVKATFSVATKSNWTDRSTGEAQESVEWHDIEVFGKQAEACIKHLKKGRLVYVRGPHHTDRWQKDGVWQSRNYIRARRVKFLGKN